VVDNISGDDVGVDEHLYNHDAKQSERDGNVVPQIEINTSEVPKISAIMFLRWISM
jgi:hypothetical protein